jgi:hypothetical protein
MSFGSALSGAASGALSGMSLGPWGAAAGGALGLAGGLFGGGGGGGGTLEYGLTPREEELQDYAFNQVRATPTRKRVIINETKDLIKTKIAVQQKPCLQVMLIVLLILNLLKNVYPKVTLDQLIITVRIFKTLLRAYTTNKAMAIVHKITIFLQKEPNQTMLGAVQPLKTY